MSSNNWNIKLEVDKLDKLGCTMVSNRFYQKAFLINIIQSFIVSYERERNEEFWSINYIA